MTQRYIGAWVNGKSFLLDTYIQPLASILTGYGDITEAYINPSKDKRELFTCWAIWFHKNRGYCSIVKRNNRNFTLNGYVTDNRTGARLYCHITPKHNICWLIKGRLKDYEHEKEELCLKY